MYLNHADLSKYYICDIEGDLIPSTKIYCMVVKNAATKEVWKFIGHADIKRFFDEAPHDAIFVGHNFISYDGPTLRRILAANVPSDRIVDTLVLSYLYHPGMPGGHSLAAYGERFGYPKDTFNDFSQFSQELLDRCEIDVELNLRVFTALCTKMRAVGFSEQSCRLEHRIREIIDAQQDRGFAFDVSGAMGFQGRLRATEYELGEKIRALFPPVLKVVKSFKNRTKKDGSPTAGYLRHLEQFPELRDHRVGNGYDGADWEIFNIGSPKQRLEKLLTLGFVPTKKTKTGGPSVDEESLIEFAKESGVDEVQAIADWLVANGRANMVGTWLDNVGGDNRIHGRVFSCGAASRRMIHNSPNTANIPGNEATYGEEARGLWMASPGLVLVGVDAKSAQMRCFAHYLPNPSDGVRFYEEGRDPHQENADLIGIKRKPIKNVFYANMFGAFPPKLAATAGFIGSRKELEERGTWIQNELYRVTPGLREATEDARAEARRTPEGWMRCLDGGYVRCPGEHAALNYRIQPAEAVLMKTASVLLDERKKEDHWKVGDIHDEWQFEVNPKEAEDFGRMAANCIRDAGEELNLRVPFDGDYKVGRSWAETH